MSESVNLPALGESVTEGTVTRWLKQVGDRVEVDEPLLEVSTDKVDTEIPSPVAGVIEEILVAEDETVEVGTALVKIGDGAGESESADPNDTTTSADEAESPAEDAGSGANDAETAQPSASAAEPAATAEQTPETPAENVVAPAAEPESDSTIVPSTDAPLPDAHDSESTPVKEEAVPTAAPESAASPTEENAPASDDAGDAASSTADASASDVTAPVSSDAAPADADSSKSDDTDADDSQVGYLTPLVRKLANERGVDLRTVTGTGVGGRIRKQDILDASEKASQSDVPADAQTANVTREISPLRGTTVSMSRLRKVIAERAVISMQSSAQLTSVVEVDVTAVANYRNSVKDEFLEKTGTKLSFLPFFALAAAEALTSNPIINATIEDNSIVYPPQENISIAVDTERGLLTPVIRDAASLDLAGLASQIADLAQRTRENKLTPDELSGGTFTLTNTGSRGALFDTPIVFLPQSAILGTGIVTKKPVVISDASGDSIGIRSMVYLALSYDHRIVDGADAARFLVDVKDRLEGGNFADKLGI